MRMIDIVLAHLFNYIPAIYLFVWLIVNVILFSFAIVNVNLAPYVLGFMVLSLIPLVLWRLIR